MAAKIFLLASSLLLAACGEFRARPDLRTSTMTLPDDGACSHGYKTRSTGTVGQYGTPVVEVTDERCAPRSTK